MDIVDMGGTMSDLRDECSDLRIEIAALRAKLETVTRENTRLTNATLCDVCGGTGQPPPEVCACEGTHQAWKVLENVRLENVRLESRIAALEAVRPRLLTLLAMRLSMKLLPPTKSCCRKGLRGVRVVGLLEMATGPLAAGIWQVWHSWPAFA